MFKSALVKLAGLLAKDRKLIKKLGVRYCI